VQPNTALYKDSYNVYLNCKDVIPKQFIYLLGCVLNCPERTIVDSKDLECVSYYSSGKTKLKL